MTSRSLLYRSLLVIGLALLAGIYLLPSILGTMPAGLGFLPESHCPHYDGETERQKIYEESIANGTLPPGIAVEDSCGVLYRGTQLVESVCSVPGKSAYRVTADGGKAKLTPIPTRILPCLIPNGDKRGE